MNKYYFIIICLICITAVSCKKTKVDYWPPSQYGTKVKKSEETFENGQKEGQSIWWYINGNKQIECFYKDGKLDGIFKRWFSNGKPDREDNYTNGVLEGYSKTYFQEGGIETEANYKNGMLDGIFISYWENGEIKSKGSYLKGLYDGEWSYYDKTSGLKIGEGHFSQGKGKILEHSIKNNAIVKETNLINNKKNGIEIWWNEQGEKIKEFLYKDDRLVDN